MSDKEIEDALKGMCGNVLFPNTDYSKLWEENPEHKDKWIVQVIIPMRLKHGVWQGFIFKNKKLMFDYISLN